MLSPVAPRDMGPRKVNMERLTQMNAVIADSITHCTFLPFSWDLKVQALNGVTGWNTSVPELMKAAERIITLFRLFNVKHGLSAKDDTLPGRFFTGKTDGVLSDKPLDRDAYEKGRLYYYASMGWDAEGVPLPDKVEELEIV